MSYAHDGIWLKLDGHKIASCVHVDIAQQLADRLNQPLPVEQQPSLRDRFAMAALTGLLSDGPPWASEKLAAKVYKAADACMAARGGAS